MGGCSQPCSTEYFRKNTAARTSAIPATAENSFTPRRLSKSNPDGGCAASEIGRHGAGGTGGGGNTRGVVLVARADAGGIAGLEVATCLGGVADSAAFSRARASSRSRASSGQGFSLGAAAGPDGGGGAAWGCVSSGHGFSRDAVSGTERDSG